MSPNVNRECERLVPTLRGRPIGDFKGDGVVGSVSRRSSGPTQPCVLTRMGRGSGKPDCHFRFWLLFLFTSMTYRKLSFAMLFR